MFSGELDASDHQLYSLRKEIGLSWDLGNKDAS